MAETMKTRLYRLSLSSDSRGIPLFDNFTGIQGDIVLTVNGNNKDLYDRLISLSKDELSSIFQYINPERCFFGKMKAGVLAEPDEKTRQNLFLSLILFDEFIFGDNLHEMLKYEDKEFPIDISCIKEKVKEWTFNCYVAVPVTLEEMDKLNSNILNPKNIFENIQYDFLNWSQIVKFYRTHFMP